MTHGKGKFPPQSPDVAWPGVEWPIASDAERKGVDDRTLQSVVAALFEHGVAPPQDRGLSLALLAVHRGRIVLERYGRQPANMFHDEREITAETPLISWSMAKSITHALIGIMVGDGLIDPNECVPVTRWAGDDRRDITWWNLLQMRDGLDFIEDYVVDPSGTTRSDVIDMLFGSGAQDVFTYATSRPLARRPGSTWSYSSGTTNVLCGLIGEILGGRAGVEAFLHRRIFEPLAMSSAQATFDDSGTFIGSSYVYATARDFARFGTLYLRGGVFDGRQILSEEWVDRARRQHAVDPDNGHGYGEHWWTWNADDQVFAALGYEGQRTIVVPERDLVVVHLGKWETSTQRFLDDQLTRLVGAIPLDN